MIKKETIPNKSDFYKFTFKFKHVHFLFYSFYTFYDKQVTLSFKETFRPRL